jgi:hypothetical protein
MIRIQTPILAWANYIHLAFAAVALRFKKGSDEQHRLGILKKKRLRRDFQFEHTDQTLNKRHVS